MYVGQSYCDYDAGAVGPFVRVGLIVFVVVVVVYITNVQFFLKLSILDNVSL